MKWGTFLPYSVVNGKRKARARTIKITRESAGEYIFKKNLKKVMIILWHHAAFVGSGIIKSAWTFPWKYFAVTVLSKYGSADSANRNIYDLIIAFP